VKLGEITPWSLLVAAIHKIHYDKGVYSSSLAARSQDIPATRSCKLALMTFDILEEGEPCDFCGVLIKFFDDDWAICPNCQAEYSNMDYIHGDINDYEGF